MAKETAINLNSASMDELLSLGLSKDEARSLISARDKSGPFTSWEDLKAAAGLSEADVQKLREHGAALGEVLEIESHGD